MSTLTSINNLHICLDISHIPLLLVVDAVEEVAASAGDTFAAAASADAVASVAAAAFDAASAAVVADPDILAAVDMLVVVVGNAVAGAVAHNHYQTAASPSVAAAASIAKKIYGISVKFHFCN